MRFAASVDSAIEAELARENVQKAFRHLKGWYWAVTEMQAKPCFQTMERQTAERVDLYARRQPPGGGLLILIVPVAVNDGVPSDDEIHYAASQLLNGRAAGTSGMRAEDVNPWLSGVWDEENPKTPAKTLAGDHWCLFVHLVQAVWPHGVIPCQLLWSIIVLIPKGGGDFRVIRLLEPIWKVLKRIIDLRLDSIELHNTLHGCRVHHGTGTAVAEAKLVQQLSYLELQPFYGVFLGLKKAFDLIDWEQCIMILGGYGVGPQMIWLIRNYWCNTVMVCCALGNYITPFQAGCGDPGWSALFHVVQHLGRCSRAQVVLAVEGR